jgi:hypothetical protein
MDPLPMFEPWSQAMRRMMDDSFTRWSASFEELARVEGKSAEQMCVAIDEASRLMKDSLNYATQYSTEWRKMSFEASRRVAELMKPSVSTQP